MSRITVDERTEQAIKAAEGSFELCDRNGATIAVGVPGKGLYYPVVIEEPPLPTDEEMKEVLKGPRFTLDQILEGLEDR